MHDPRAALAGQFRSISLERVERLGNAVLALVKDPSQATVVDEMMREAHTLKGESKLMGFEAVSTTAHQVEDLLNHTRGRGFQLTAKEQALIFEGLDLIAALLPRPDGAEPPPADVSVFATAVREVLGRGEALAATKVEAPASLADASARSIRNGRAVASSLRVEAAKIERLTDLSGALRSTEGELLAAADEVSVGRGRLLQCDAALEEASAHLGGAGDAAPARVAVCAALRHAHQLSRHLARVTSQLESASFAHRLRVKSLEDSVSNLRMLPLSSIFAQYPRAVSKLALEQEKCVDVVVDGDDVEVDKEVLERLAEPLLHLLRNAVDHGIEGRDERERVGKGARGTLRLSARVQGSTVELRVADDGRGIDTDVVRRLAIARGVLSELEAEQAAPESVLDCLFEPGFTTRPTISELSGRGVGLDVVRTRVRGLGGEVRLESRLGLGTEFCVSVPTSTVRATAVVVSLDGALFAVAVHHVETLLTLAPADLERSGTGSVFRLQERPVPLAELRTLLDLPSAQEFTGPVLVLKHGGQLRGVRVDRCLGTRIVVQRGGGKFLEDSLLVRGTGVLEDSALAIVLDVAGLFQIWDSGGTTSARRPAARLARARVLVVDDSELTRELLVSTLRASGHEVSEAVDGRDALARVEMQVPDLILTDLDMPVVNGFQLIERLRARHETAAVPIVVLSTRGSEEDMLKASSLGADAYLVKTRYRGDDLRKVVERLVHQGAP